MKKALNQAEGRYVRPVSPINVYTKGRRVGQTGRSISELSAADLAEMLVAVGQCDLTVPEAAEMYGVQDSSLRRFLREGPWLREVKLSESVEKLIGGVAASKLTPAQVSDLNGLEFACKAIAMDRSGSFTVSQIASRLKVDVAKVESAVAAAGYRGFTVLSEELVVQIAALAAQGLSVAKICKGLKCSDYLVLAVKRANAGQVIPTCLTANNGLKVVDGKMQGKVSWKGTDNFRRDVFVVEPVSLPDLQTMAWAIVKGVTL